ncbi:MAG: hypothetical protein N2037_14325 [Acidimicrobiales bacterium]|nr:hypothetical protein [Acidimicrobiales bacterium]
MSSVAGPDDWGRSVFRFLARSVAGAKFFAGPTGRVRLVLVAVFAVSRAVYWWAGVRFDASGLTYSSQLLDPELLRNDLWTSLWYLHAQPPLFNLFVGLVLRWSPLAPPTSFHAAYVVLGLVLLFALHELGRLLRLGRVVAGVVAAVITCAPTTVLYENWLSYEYPVAVALVVLVVLAGRYGVAPNVGLLVGCAAVGSAAVLTRSLLHPVWLIGVVGVLLAYRWPPPRRALIVGVPLLVVAGVMFKNQLLFGTPQLSSWFGFNLHRVVVEPLTDAQRAQLAEEGVGPVTASPQPAPPCGLHHPQVPAVARQYKHQGQLFDGAPIENFNYECVIEQYAGLADESVRVLRAHPRWYVRNVVGSAELWATPASLTPFVYYNRQEIGSLDEWYRRLVLLDVAWDPPVAIPGAWPVALSAPDRRFHLSFTIVVATMVVSLAGLVGLVQWRRRNCARLAVVIGGVTVGYVTAASIFLEFGENNRFRFIVEPLTFVLFAGVIGWAIRRLLAIRRRSSGQG